MDVNKKDSLIPTILPGLLTDDELIQQLNENFPAIKNLKNKTREQLMTLFAQMLLPFPQRDYHITHRGKLLTEQRLRGGLSCKADKNSVLIASQTTYQPYFKRTGVGDRLKPAPSMSETKIRVSCQASAEKTTSNKIILNRSQAQGAKVCDSIKSEKSIVTLKRAHTSEEVSLADVKDSPKKSKRTKITWP